MKINQDHVPSTFDEAVQMLIASLDPEDIAHIKADADPAGAHHGAGTALRNSWSLWERDTPLSLDFQKRFKLFGHGDDISGLLMQAVWASVRGEPAKLEEEAEYFRKHWAKQGIDPLTGEKL